MEATAATQVPRTWPDLAVVNDKSSGVSDEDAHAMFTACWQQVLEHFGPAWHAGCHAHFVESGAVPPAGMWTIVLLDSSDQAGALGYHDLTPDGLPLGKVFAGTDRQVGDKVSVTLSHEWLEMLADPWISLASQAADGRFYAWEACDAVEADSLGYEIGGVTVSAFVTPAWFGGGSGPFSYPADRVGSPLALAAGGYISVFDPSSGQGWQQTQVQHAPGLARPLGAVASPAEAMRAVPRVGSRRERRFRSRGRWVRSTYEQG